MCTHTTSACVFPFYLPIETDELQPAHMISYLPVTFYLCASSYSNSHGAQIKKKKYKKQEFLKNSLKTRIVARFGHYDSLPTKSHPQVKLFFFLLLCTQKTQHVPLVQTWQQKRNQTQFFLVFFLNKYQLVNVLA